QKPRSLRLQLPTPAAAPCPLWSLGAGCIIMLCCLHIGPCKVGKHLTAKFPDKFCFVGAGAMHIDSAKACLEVLLDWLDAFLSRRGYLSRLFELFIWHFLQRFPFELPGVAYRRVEY